MKDYGDAATPGQKAVIDRLAAKVKENLKLTEDEKALQEGAALAKRDKQPREGRVSRSQNELEARLLKKLGKEDWERANVLAQVPQVDADGALALARKHNAEGMLGQLARMEEADRVLQLAWEAGVFEDCVYKRAGVLAGYRDLDPDRLEETRAALAARAIELLADQYADLHVKVTQLHLWTNMRSMRRCPVRTLGGPQGGAK